MASIYDKHKDKVLTMRKQGKTYDEVIEALGLPCTRAYLSVLVGRWGGASSGAQDNGRRVPLPTSERGREAALLVADGMLAKDAAVKVGMTPQAVYSQFSRVGFNFRDWRGKGRNVLLAEEAALARKPEASPEPAPKPRQLPLPPPPSPASPAAPSREEMLRQLLAQPPELEAQLKTVTAERDALKLALELLLEKVTGRV